MGWKSIDTAPKDGTNILICDNASRYYFPITARWGTYHPNAKGKETWRDLMGVKVEPTHWMELPPPPNTFNNKLNVILRSELLDYYHEHNNFDELGDFFDFIGEDGKTYIFDVQEFNSLIKEYREYEVVETLSLVNGSIKKMLEHKICCLKLI